jgi:two-component system osmolarity sensor histidine kinase EnvZ
LRSPNSLARQNALALAVAFIVIELLTLTLFTLWVLLPLAKRSADDLAGLIVLSAQTWAELPPHTRPAFEEELFNSHALALRAEPPHSSTDAWHSPYFYLLEEAVNRRTGLTQHLSSEQQDSGTWYWVNVPVAGTRLTVGMAAARIESQPATAFLVMLVLGSLLAVAMAIWLARQLTRPMAKLEAASAVIGEGGNPALLPETGPREVAALSRRFNAMATQVRELLASRTTLLAGVSHDLRTPLTRMRLALEMLKGHPDPTMIERLEYDIEQMNQLIGNVLDLARGLAHEKPAPIALPEYLAQLALDHGTPTNPVAVTCPPCQVAAPRVALQRAIGNLLQNAHRYAPGGVDLVVEMTPQHCRIGVLDRGPGIAPDQLEAVFEPFFRLDASRSPVTGGSGLGLAIVRELARVNGWQVSLQPREGGGLQAWLELPLPGA